MPNHSIGSFTDLADLASARLGGRALAANDEFFASRANLLKPEPAVFIPGKFTSRGKWMDGWESKRRRTPGHDWCVIRLGSRGVVHGVNIDTSHFTGNFPSHASIEAVDSSRALTPSVYASEGPPWTTLLPKSVLRGSGPNLFAVGDRRPWTHLRLSIYPDGGVARLRVHGEVAMDWPRVARAGRALDLAAVEHGGLVLDASDMHFGAKGNLIMPGRAPNMGDGWETRRRRGPGFDWAIVRLGTPGLVQKIEIDTNHYKGNYPDSASVEACFAPGASIEALKAGAWTELLPQTKLKGHHRHAFARTLRASGPVSHVRLNIFPDGGISRFRVHGTVAPA